MCGIAGFIQTSGRDEPAGVLEAMAAAIHHRGPDGKGYYRDAYAKFAHLRLSIVDLAGGHQPMSNEDDRLWIVYNGEIFNHVGIRDTLEQAGHRYKSHCDTETILHAYEEYGADCVKHFRGMFAFAIWDKQSRTLFAARDRLGIKPLYYYWDGSVFAFASEIKALFAHPSISPRLNESLLAEHLGFGYTSGEATLFQSIHRLAPGHTLRLRLDGDSAAPEIRQYWDVPAPGPAEQRSDSEWIQECRQRLEETVRMRLMSDVPLGMFLSGGVDSSAIAAIMKRIVSTPVQTFSVGYAEAEYSELGYARQVADAIGTEHHEVRISSQDFFQALPKLVWHEDEPIAWPSSVSLYFVSKLAAERVKVVLTGEGSDEMFAGYSRYKFYQLNQNWNRVYGLAPEGLRHLVRSGIANSPLLSASLRRKLGHTFLGREATLESLYIDNFYSGFSRQEQQSLFRLPQSSSDLYTGFRRYWDASQDRDLLSRLLYTDMKSYLAELLMKQDQMSMACSIESRVPFLDHTFVEFSARVPAHLKIRGGQGKYIVKKAVEGLLPNDIIYRTKMGFPTPLRQWLREPAAAPLYDFLQDKNGLLAAYTDGPELAKLLNQHRGGVQDATDRIWRLLNLQIWGSLFFGGKGIDLFDESFLAPART